MVYSDKHRKINVTTDNVKIQATLRQLEQPISLFGEGPAERRKRLQNLISSLSNDEIAKILRPDQLQTARYWIAEYSLSRSKERIEKLKEYVAIPEVYRTANIQVLYRELRATTLHCSQLGDNLPLSYCEFNPNDQMVAVSSWYLDFVFSDLHSFFFWQKLSNVDFQLTSFK
ncbi:unnamed protein product [Rotaria magnacalcarata]|uniref:Pre-mRNA processing factor 4 (PRP4)-like domain-containing protein n=2 Tax=Rotaria magnacalcarata TaxID=392030 RepID=A0A815I983_9BILA|nr:unnamed protein product [Rotaria magnacalcarata]